MNNDEHGKQTSNLLFVVFLCAAWFAIGWVVNEKWGNNAPALLDDAYQKIYKESLFNQRTQTELSYAAIRGMLSEVDDPYAELIEPQAAQGLVDTFAGKTGVIGLYADNQDGKVVVMIVFPGGPADLAGIQTGDVILSIDGVVLDKDADSSETGLLMRGTPDTPVRIEILREDKLYEYSIVRQQREFVSTEMLPNNIAYLSLNAFNVTASESFKEALVSILEQQPTGIIFDLRNNEGGDMQAAQEILSFFIEDGLLFKAELTQDRTEDFFALGDAFAADIPLVVLMDGSTYSAAETTAIAIADLGRGITIGSNTYGKGMIQATMPLVDDAMLQITIAKWLSSKGEWYQGGGVPPQIEVYDNPDTPEDELIEKAAELLLSQP